MKKMILERYAKMSKREKRILVLTLCALAVVGSDQLVMRPILGKLQSLNRQIEDEEASVRKSMHVLVSKKRIMAESSDFSSYAVEGKNQEEEMTSLLKEIESLAQRASVNLLYVKPSTIKEDAGSKRYLAQLECESQMEQVAAFFHSVESSTKLLRIEKFEIQPKSKESSIARTALTISKTVLA